MRMVWSSVFQYLAKLTASGVRKLQLKCVNKYEYQLFSIAIVQEQTSGEATGTVCGCLLNQPLRYAFEWIMNVLQFFYRGKRLYLLT